MIRFVFAHLLEVRSAGFVFGDPLFRERAVLDFGQDLLHGLANTRVDDSRTAAVVAVLGSITYGITHVAEAALIEQIDDQLQLVQAFEVGDLGLITCFNQRLESRLHECAHAAAKNRLLPEKVAFRFFLERGFDDAGFEVSRRP